MLQMSLAGISRSRSCRNTSTCNHDGVLDFITALLGMLCTKHSIGVLYGAKAMAEYA